MKIDFDFLISQLDSAIFLADGIIASEKLGGNVVKEAYAKGEKLAYERMKIWLDGCREKVQKELKGKI